MQDVSRSVQDGTRGGTHLAICAPVRAAADAAAAYVCSACQGLEASMTPLLEARGIVKRYGHVTALSGADFTVNTGEVVALIGDNGAGKSTLVKVLSGVISHDEGEMLLQGKPTRLDSPQHARQEYIYKLNC